MRPCRSLAEKDGLSSPIPCQPVKGWTVVTHPLLSKEVAFILTSLCCLKGGLRLPPFNLSVVHRDVQPGFYAFNLNRLQSENPLHIPATKQHCDNSTTDILEGGPRSPRKAGGGRRQESCGLSTSHSSIASTLFVSPQFSENAQHHGGHFSLKSRLPLRKRMHHLYQLDNTLPLISSQSRWGLSAFSRQGCPTGKSGLRPRPPSPLQGGTRNHLLLLIANLRPGRLLGGHPLSHGSVHG